MPRIAFILCCVLLFLSFVFAQKFALENVLENENRRKRKRGKLLWKASLTSPSAPSHSPRPALFALCARPRNPRGPTSPKPSLGRSAPFLSALGPHISLPGWLTRGPHKSAASPSPSWNRRRAGHHLPNRFRDNRDFLANRVHQAPIKGAGLAPHPVFPPCREIKL